VDDPTRGDSVTPARARRRNAPIHFVWACSGGAHDIRALPSLPPGRPRHPIAGRRWKSLSISKTCPSDFAGAGRSQRPSSVAAAPHVKRPTRSTRSLVTARQPTAVARAGQLWTQDRSGRDCDGDSRPSRRLQGRAAVVGAAGSGRANADRRSLSRSRGAVLDRPLQTGGSPLQHRERRRGRGGRIRRFSSTMPGCQTPPDRPCQSLIRLAIARFFAAGVKTSPLSARTSGVWM
jgi:hypothetical protein